MLTLAFTIQQVEALPEVILSDKEIISNPGYTSNIAFTATVSSPTTTNIWFQIKATLNETGLRFSQCVEDVMLEDSTRLTIEWVLDPLDPRFDRLPTIVGNTVYMVDWFGDNGGNSTNQGLPLNWVYGITTVYDDWEYALTGYLSEIAPQAPHTIVVPDDYPTIQEAINVANEGDTIFVRSGIYYEHVVLNKTVSLLGVEGPTIDASQEVVGMITPSIAKWNGITILANYCTVTGFEIRNAANFGIEIRADYGVFQNNLVENCNHAGISLYAGVHDGVMYHSSHDNLIRNNTVSLNHMGIWLSAAYNNIVSLNTIERNGWNGIYLSSGAKNNTIISNSVSNSIGTQYNEGGYGIAVGTGSHNNVIAGNDISNNSADGIRIEIFGLGFPLPYANTVFHNNFVGNTIQAFDDGINNTWDGGYPSGGNYWSDYEERYPNATEIDDSGIWNTPYYIYWYNQDNYPLVNPWETTAPPEPVNLPPIANFTYSPTVPIVNEIVTFDASSSYDPDGTIIGYSWAFGDGTIANDTGPIITHAYADAGNYSVTLYVYDDYYQPDSYTLNVTVTHQQVPVEATQELIETIETWNLHKGTENSLKAKLKAAIHMLDMGKEDGAIRKLTAFINRVEMLREKTLTN